LGAAASSVAGKGKEDGCRVLACMVRGCGSPAEHAHEPHHLGFVLFCGKHAERHMKGGRLVLQDGREVRPHTFSVKERG